MSLDRFIEVRPIPVTASIQGSVDRMLRQIDYKTIALVANVDLDSARVAVMINLGAGWSFSGYLDKPYTGPLEGGAQVIFSR